MPGHIVRSIERNRLFFFFILAYMISWIIWAPMVILDREIRPLLILGSLGPAISALIIIWTVRGRPGIKDIIDRLLIWRVNPAWYAVIILGPAVIVLSAIWIYVSTGGSMPVFNDPAQWYLIIVFFIYILFLSVLGEEIGWRGFALPELLSRYNALVSSLILGILWGMWHLPLFFIGNNFHSEIPLSIFLLQIIASTILYTWIYNNTGGSLLMVVLFHTASNTAAGIFPVLPMDTGGDVMPFYILVGLLCIVAIAVTVIYGPEKLSRKA